jgi:peptidoglycan/xylan/chitin deacetylase (PgdA/CDA1 family)
VTRAVLALAALLALAGDAGGATRLEPVPILMYHVVAAPPASAPYPALYVPRPEFAAEIDELARHGYQEVTLQQVFDHWRGAARLPARPIVLSFDDGYRSDFANALPILRARGWAGVLNLEVANEKPVWGVRPGMVRALIRAGWEIDSHTLTHPDLTTLDSSRLREEVSGSRSTLRRQFHVPVNFFCYPSGRYDAAVVAAVQAAGYVGATTARYGLARPGELYTLERVSVHGGDGARGLEAKLQALGLP